MCEVFTEPFDQVVLPTDRTSDRLLPSDKTVVYQLLRTSLALEKHLGWLLAPILMET
jgi:hypothetical protein